VSITEQQELPMSAERAIQTVEPRPDESTAIIQVIERAAMNPNVDIDKMERLLLMQERIVERNAKTAYAAALAEAQPALPVVDRKGVISVPPKDGKAGHETPYAKWEDINDAIRPVLAEHGFALSFRIGKDADRVVVTGVLSHREGHSEETTLSLPMDSTGSKNNVQAIGSSVSYGKRYTAGALLNFTTRGEDDDGTSGGARGQSAAAEAATAAINACNTVADLKTWKVKNADNLAQLPTKEADAIVRLFNRRVESLKGGQS
jgi:hypothetical protein